jgi:serine/threonine-protein kinase TNNI3K
MGIDGTLTNYTSIWNNPELLAVKVSVDEIQDVRKIGSGAFADVWLVKFRKTQFATSKRLRKDQVTLERTQGFIKEIKLVSTLQHSSIVQFMGAAWVMENDLQALFEFMEGGDLRSYLIDLRSPREWGTEKLQIAVDIAEALVYVHSFAPPLVHRDLKSLSMLLAADARAKLTDFGVSQVQSNQNTMTTGAGTGRWLAPEVIFGSLDYGPPSNIFSFGAVLSELDSHELPYGSLRGANGNQLVDVAMLQLVEVGQLKPTFSASCPEKIAELASRLCSWIF